MTLTLEWANGTVLASTPGPALPWSPTGPRTLPQDALLVLNSTETLTGSTFHLGDGPSFTGDVQVVLP